MRRHVVGTAGHVDHGKTALVRALTGVDTDRLPEEKRRGISIELGFARLEVGPGVEASIIDVPGHRRFVSTMIAGASGIELVLLAVAADEGVMPQTREHVEVCALLGIRRCVVAVTKLDKVDRQLAGIAEAEARELLGGRFDAVFVPCSARTGEGIDAVRAALCDKLETEPVLEPASGGAERAAARPRIDAPAMLSVDRVFSVRGAGTVITGTLVQGRLCAGDRVWILSSRGSEPSSIRSLEVHGARLPNVVAPARVAVNLAGARTESVHRGDRLSGRSDIPITESIEVELYPVAPLRRGVELSLHVGTSRATASLAWLHERESGAAGAYFGRLRLRAPAPIAGGDRILLRGSRLDGPRGAIVAGGIVLDAAAPRRPARRRLEILTALSSGNAVDAVRALAAEQAPRSLPEGALVSRYALDRGELVRAARALATGRELVVTGTGFVGATTVRMLLGEARELVHRQYRASPHQLGISRETLLRQIAARAGEDVAACVLHALTREPDIAFEGELLIVPTLSESLGAEPSGEVGDVIRELRAAGGHGRTEAFLAEALGIDRRSLAAILNRLGRRKLAIRAGDLWFDIAIVQRARAIVAEHFGSGRPFSVVDFKSRSGLARRQAIVLLEYLDGLGITRRSGDVRCVVRDAGASGRASN